MLLVCCEEDLVYEPLFELLLWFLFVALVCFLSGLFTAPCLLWVAFTSLFWLAVCGLRVTLPVEGLFAALTNVNFDNDALLAMMDRVDIEKQKLVPECYRCASSCGRNNDYDMSKLWNADEAGAYPAVKESVYIEITSYGGDTTGYQIPFTIHYTGEKVKGTFNLSTKTFTAA